MGEGEMMTEGEGVVGIFNAVFREVSLYILQEICVNTVSVPLEESCVVMMSSKDG